MIVSAEHAVTVRGAEMLSRTYVFGDNQQVAVALYSKDHRRHLRIQYGCLLGTAFGSADCDCAEQVRSAINIISGEGGVLIYFRDHEALGLGIFEKAQLLAHEHLSQEAHHKSLERLHSTQSRHAVTAYVPDILSAIDATSFVLLGDNREKLAALRQNGVIIESVRALPADLSAMTSFARNELTWKAAYLARHDHQTKHSR